MGQLKEFLAQKDHMLIPEQDHVRDYRNQDEASQPYSDLMCHMKVADKKKMPGQICLTGREISTLWVG